MNSLLSRALLRIFHPSNFVLSVYLSAASKEWPDDRESAILPFGFALQTTHITDADGQSTKPVFSTKVKLRAVPNR